MNIDTSKIKSTHWSELILQMYGNSDYYDYARTISYQEFWNNCPKGEWLLYFVCKEGSTPHKLIVKAACQCARLSLPYVKKGDLQPLKAIKATERWLENKATIKEVRLAVTAVYAASASYAADSAAAAAASAATAAYFHVDYPSAADAASFADYATDEAAKKKKCSKKTADIVRSIIPMPTQAVSEFDRLVKMKAFW